MQTLALLRKHELNSTIGLVDGKSVNCSEFIGQAIGLSDNLPDTNYLIQLCDEPYYFLLSFVAALIKQKTLILPPNKALGTIEELCSKYNNARIICDKESNEGVKNSGSINCRKIFDSQPSSEIPQISEEHICVVLHTSGTTGKPKAHSKTWKSLVKGCELTGYALQIRQGSYCLSTVPPQHMYGLETSIMFVLQQGGVCINKMPVFPADIVHELENLPQPRILITTPLQLKAIADTTECFPESDFVISATAPLSKEIAVKVESLGTTLIQEIYGSTETGALAIRHTAKQEHWSPLNNIQFKCGEKEWSVYAEHYESEQLIADQLEFKDNKFRIIGRNEDLIKISGKRGSLSHLNEVLNSIDGVEDGYCFLPEAEDLKSRRIAAIVVSKTLTIKQILSSLRLKIDPVFIPRPLIIVEKIPRNSLGKIARNEIDRLFEDNKNV